MNVTWNLYLKPKDIAKIAALKEGEKLKLKTPDCVIEYKNGEYEFEVYDEFDMLDYS